MTNSQPSLQQQAAQELLRRRKARSSLLAFTQYTKPDYTVNWHHQVLCEHLDKFAAGDITRLMVFMPPQHGKSELVSRKLPAFIFGREPDTKLVAASYTADLIQQMNSDVQRVIDSDEYRKLFPETALNGSNVRTVSGGSLRNNEIFEIVKHAGRYRCAGVGGGLTGFAADVSIIDDPYKDYEEAMSPRVRQTVWEWYTSVFLSRTHVRTRILITLTRWHEADLAGQLLALEGNAAEGGDWTVLTLPAICEEEDVGRPHERRQIGEALWPERFPVSLLEKRRRLNRSQFHALYQQQPKPKSGNMFDQSLVLKVDAVPFHADRVRRWDMAATEDGGDWTVGILMARVGGEFYVEDYVAAQLGPYARNKLIKSVAVRDHAKYGCGVLTIGPQDPGAAGVDAALAFIQLLSGYRVETEVETGSKELRAEPFSDQWGAGNVRVLRAEWTDQYLDRMAGFPHSGKDEGDASSGAYNKLALGWEEELEEEVVVYDERVNISRY